MNARTARATLIAAGIAAGLATPARAQEPQGPPPGPRPAVVRASADATVDAKPDQARLDVGVVTTSATAQAAGAENAAKLERVIAAVRAALGPRDTVQTASYALNPNYVYPREGGDPKLTGYTATNVVRVTTVDLTRVGRIIDAATGAGSNTVQNLQFTLENDSSVREEALMEATRLARRRAEAIARALGVRVLGVLAAEEGVQQVRPVFAEAAMMKTASDAATPVEPGTIEVNATVTVTLAIANP